MTDTLTGGCRCGQVRYRIPAQPIAVNCCHCSLCQSLTGSAFAVNAVVPTEALELIGAATPVEGHIPTEAPGGKRTWACGACGVMLYADNGYVGDGKRFVRTGTLDDPSAVAPGAHFFVRNKLPWVTIPDGVKTYDTVPDRR